MKLKLLLLVMFLGSIANAQFTSTARHIGQYAVAPATCNPATGDIYYNTTSNKPFFCSALNTWTAFATGISVTIPSTTNVLKGDGAGNGATSTFTDGGTPANGDATVNVADTLFIANVIQTLNPAVAVQAATTAVLSNTPTYANGSSGVGATLTAGSNGVLTIDGYSPVLNDRVLVKNQAASLQNGIYTLTTVGTAGVPYVLTRAVDYNSISNIIYTGDIPVNLGTTCGGDTAPPCSYLLQTPYPTVIGTSAITYTLDSTNPSGPPGGNVKGSGALGNTQCVTGAGGKTIQTPSANCTVDANGNLNAASVTTGPSTDGGLYMKGFTSGGLAFSVADIAGTAITMVMSATNPAAGQQMYDTGAITCPANKPASFPATCHQFGWLTVGGMVPITGTGAPIASIPTTGWTLINAGSGGAAAVIDDFSSSFIDMVVGDAAALNWRLYTRSIGISPPYTIYASITCQTADPAGNSQVCGFYLSDGTKIEGFEIFAQCGPGVTNCNVGLGSGTAQGGTHQLRIETMNSVTSDNTTVSAATGGIIGRQLSVKLIDDNTNRTWCYWTNGAWHRKLQELTNTFLTPTTVGIGALSTIGTTSYVVDSRLEYFFQKSGADAVCT